jgi:hypothetical protein
LVIEKFKEKKAAVDKANQMMWSYSLICRKLKKR